MNWVGHILGLDNLSGPWYGFWSGFGSDMSEVIMFGWLYAFLRKHNCHVQGCWRIGRHAVDGYVVCARHHPKGAPTAEDIPAG